MEECGNAVIRFVESRIEIEEREIKKYIRGKRRRETGQTHARVSPSGGAAVCEGSLVGERE